MSEPEEGFKVALFTSAQEASEALKDQDLLIHEVLSLRADVEKLRQDVNCHGDQLLDLHQKYLAISTELTSLYTKLNEDAAIQWKLIEAMKLATNHVWSQKYYP